MEVEPEDIITELEDAVIRHKVIPILRLCGAPSNERTIAMAKHCSHTLELLVLEGVAFGNPWTSSDFDGLADSFPGLANLLPEEGSVADYVNFAHVQSAHRYMDKLKQSWEGVLEKWEEWK
jgi:hypothetical protein